jgi:hypothetical protein
MNLNVNKWFVKTNQKTNIKHKHKQNTQNIHTKNLKHIIKTKNVSIICTWKNRVAPTLVVPIK